MGFVSAIPSVLTRALVQCNPLIVIRTIRTPIWIPSESPPFFFTFQGSDMDRSLLQQPRQLLYVRSGRGLHPRLLQPLWSGQRLRPLQASDQPDFG